MRTLLLTIILVAGCQAGDPSGGDKEADTVADTDTDTDTDTDADADTDADTDTVDLGPPEPAACGLWAEGTQDDDGGATRDFYNRGAGLPWRNELGDWADASGVAQGLDPFAVAAVPDDNTPAWVAWDVTSLVQGWADGTWPAKGFLLRSEPGPFVFASKEHGVAGERPELVLITAAGTDTLVPEADTYVAASTYQGYGDAETLRVDDDQNTLIRFDLDPYAGQLITSATLRLYKLEDYGGTTRDVAVYRSDHGLDRPLTAPVPGLAESYVGDAGIDGDPAVLLFSDFEDAAWADLWSSVSPEDHFDLVDATEGNGFVPLDGQALRLRVAGGDNYGGSMRFRYADETGSEPEEAWFRYHLRIGDDWAPSDGGKLPGFAGTYGVAGWGGRPVNGTDGWSARGTYTLPVATGNPLAGHTTVGNYVYHADMAGSYGDVDLWLDGCAGVLEKGRWYSIETHLRMNTPGLNDGVLEGWIDGRLAYRRVDWRWRDVATLNIEEVWMNVYHGGTATAPADMHLYIDNVVVATEPIGPMGR